MMAMAMSVSMMQMNDEWPHIMWNNVRTCTVAYKTEDNQKENNKEDQRG